MPVIFYTLSIKKHKMKIDLNDIFNFYEMRIACHVKSMNYFASLLGYHFPEHDGDKIEEPIRTGYAYIFYQAYHKKLVLNDEYEKLCDIAKNTHHNHATHHIEHYKNVRDIPDICLYEMVADWASANFEQMNILQEDCAVPISDWFNNNMKKLNWTEHQLKIIYDSFDIINKKTENDKIMAIWQPLLKLADL